MQDPCKTINVTKVLAGTFGTIGLVLVLLNFFDGPTDEVGILGLTCVCTGAVLRIRSWFVQVCRRETNAFQLGRDYERQQSHDNVRSLN